MPTTSARRARPVVPAPRQRRASASHPRPSGVAGACACDALEPRRLFADVGLALDTSFGDGGRASLNVRPRDTAYDAVRLADGKFVLAGSAGPATTSSLSIVVDGLVARFNADGSPDATFGTGGAALLPLGVPLGRMEVTAVVPLPGGKLLVGASRTRPSDSPTPTPRDLLLARFNADGTPDGGFGPDGTGVVLAVPQARLYDLVALPDGKFLAGGFKSDATNGSSRAVLWRFSEDGTLDATFGQGGQVIHGTPQNGWVAVERLVPRPDGLFSGTINHRLALLHPDGSLAHVSGGDAWSATGGYPESLTLLPDGKLLLARGSVGGGFAVNRVLADGITLDPTFDNATVHTIGGDHDRPSGLAVTPDGGVIVAARTRVDATQRDYGTLLRLLPDGRRDPAAPATPRLGFNWTIDGVMHPFVTGDEVVVTGQATAPHGSPHGAHDLLLGRYRLDPGITADAGGPYAADENVPFLVRATASYAGGRITRYEWDTDFQGVDFTPDGEGQFTALRARDDTPAPVAALRVTTSDGLLAVAPVPLAVRNAAPAVLAFDVPPVVPKGVWLPLRGSFVDPGEDVFEVTYNFGDGVVQRQSGLRASTFQTNYAFRPGTWNVTVTVTDDEGAAGSATRTVTSVDLVGTVFEDEDDDGVRDDAEKPRPGETVFLDADDDGALDPGELSAVTDASGRYWFAGVGNQSHVLRHVAPDGWRHTTQAGGRAAVTINGAVGALVDFGLTRRARITGSVFFDSDADGIHDPGEATRGTPYVDLDDDGEFDPGEPVAFVPHNAWTTYVIAGLEAGTYSIRYHAGDNYVVTAPAGGAHRVTVGSGEVAGGYDLGVTNAPATVQGFVWRDDDGDGTRDPEEVGVRGAIVFADLDGDGALDAGERRARTNAGAYRFGVTNAGQTLRVLAPDGSVLSAGADGHRITTGTNYSDLDFGLRPTLPPAVVGRHLFYAGSAFHSWSSVDRWQVDAALAADKTALMPGGPATLANVSNYDQGITGVFLDVRWRPSPALRREDFTVRAGRGGDPSAWAVVPGPDVIRTRDGHGVGSTERVELGFAPGRLRDTWVQITVVANERTGLAAPDVFYFGHLTGAVAAEGAPADLKVDARDLAAVRRRVARDGAARVGPGDAFDINRDGWVSAADVARVRANLGRGLPPLTTPASAGAASAAVPPLSTARIVASRRSALRDVLSD